METFAERLRAARAATGMSQQKMSDYMLISKRNIEKWETGERVPPEYVQRFILNELEKKNDEPKIVRCKDCLFYDSTAYTESGKFCSMHSGAYHYVEMDPEDYCSYAQRKESEAVNAENDSKL